MLAKIYSPNEKGLSKNKLEKSCVVTHDAGYSNLIMVEELKKLYKIKLYIDDITSSFKVETDSKYEVQRRRKK